MQTWWRSHSWKNCPYSSARGDHPCRTVQCMNRPYNSEEQFSLYRIKSSIKAPPRDGSDQIYNDYEDGEEVVEQLEVEVKDLEDKLLPLRRTTPSIFREKLESLLGVWGGCVGWGGMGSAHWVCRGVLGRVKAHPGCAWCGWVHALGQVGA
eukprot:Gb_15912 [translate_table: standard]